MTFPFDQRALEHRLLALQNALLRSGGVMRSALSPEEQAVRDFGQELFDALMVGDVRSRFDVSRQEALRAGKGLRIKLCIQSPRLAALPWEFLYDSRQAEYLALSRDTPIVRYLELPHTVQPLAVQLPLRILAMIAAPADLRPLDVASEKTRLERALAPLVQQGQMELQWLQGQTWRELQQAMRTGPWHIFHFIGHGSFSAAIGEGIIWLTDDRGSQWPLAATQLARLLADHHTLRLVLLNTCESARGSEEDVFSSTASILVRRGIPAVLAMQYAITDAAAIEFSRTFYDTLADGLPVDAAVSEARKAVSFGVTNSLEWGTPVLCTYARDGVLFQVAPSAAPPPVVKERKEPVPEAPPPSVPKPQDLPEASVPIVPIFDCELIPVEASGIQGAIFDLRVHNRGQRDLVLTLSAQDPTGTASFVFTPDRLVIPAAASGSARLTIRATHRLARASTLEHRFQVVVQPASAPQATHRLDGLWQQYEPAAAPMARGRASTARIDTAFEQVVAMCKDAHRLTVRTTTFVVIGAVIAAVAAVFIFAPYSLEDVIAVLLTAGFSALWVLGMPAAIILSIWSWVRRRRVLREAIYDANLDAHELVDLLARLDKHVAVNKQHAGDVRLFGKELRKRL
ncbi:MAG: CHAT domain-containing protein [Caldilineaceae bacterium]|nr:CHAT domain-containing protein [Caldilineaceae bacterium]